MRIINEQIFLNDSGLTVKPKTDIVVHEYLGYYLLYNQNKIYKCARGTAQKNLEMNMFKDILIPIPTIEKQNEIIKFCREKDEENIRLEKEIQNNKKLSQEMLLKID